MAGNPYGNPYKCKICGGLGSKDNYCKNHRPANNSVSQAYFPKYVRKNYIDYNFTQNKTSLQEQTEYPCVKDHFDVEDGY